MLMPRVLLLAGVAAMLPLSAGSRAEAPQAAGRFTPPSGPMKLTRTVWRGLFDGKAIKVERSYAITITPDGDGYRVDGTPIETLVDAPPQVAMVAELERKRSEIGLFPFHLDREGRIITQPTALPGDASLSRAGSKLVAGANIPAGQRQETQAMLDQVIGATRSGAAWPTDLFNPASASRQDQREIALPGGTKGAVKVSIVADLGSPGQLPRSFERTVTTMLGDTESVTREEWTMGTR